MVGNEHIDFYAEKGNFLESRITGSKTQREADVLEKRLLQFTKKFNDLNKILLTDAETLDKDYREPVVHLDDINFNVVDVSVKDEPIDVLYHG